MRGSNLDIDDGVSYGVLRQPQGVHAFGEQLMRFGADDGDDETAPGQPIQRRQ